MDPFLCSLSQLHDAFVVLLVQLAVFAHSILFPPNLVPVNAAISLHPAQVTFDTNPAPAA